MPEDMQLPLISRPMEKIRAHVGEIPIDKHFPEEKANEIGRLESYNKHLYRPNTYLHKWWARRSGTTFRYILKQLVRNEHHRYYYEPGGLEGQVILDPMMGGGTVLHEAIRLGANVIGIDIDPIPVLQTRATLELSNVGHRRKVYESFFRALRSKLLPLYETVCPICGKQAETQFVLYGVRKCCSCREVLIVDSLTIREESPDDVVICPRCQAVTCERGHKCSNPSQESIITKAVRECRYCRNTFEEILDEPFAKRYAPLVIVGHCNDHGQFYKSLEDCDYLAIRRAHEESGELDFGPPEAFQVPEGPKSNDLLRRNVKTFLDVFTARQLLYIHHCHNLLSEVAARDKLWLSLLISTSLEFNSLLCGYKGRAKQRPGAIRHVFSHHAYSFPYTALENNPVFSGKASGTLNRLFQDRIVKAGKWAKVPVERYVTKKGTKKVMVNEEIDGGLPVADWEDLRSGTRKFLLLQGDSAQIPLPDNIADHVITDPPYYDSVQYSDLSNFFRVWLHVLLPGEANWKYDYSKSAVSNCHNSLHDGYLRALAAIWKTCSRALKPGGRLIFTYHHWKADAWADLTISLREVGFELVNRYVVASENPISVHIRHLHAIKHDTILVLRPARRQAGGEGWAEPEAVSKEDSYAFCRDCGSVLGWLLSSSHSHESIRVEWARFLGDQ